jgi:hypothetical protein
MLQGITQEQLAIATYQGMPPTNTVRNHTSCKLANGLSEGLVSDHPYRPCLVSAGVVVLLMPVMRNTRETAEAPTSASVGGRIHELAFNINERNGRSVQDFMREGEIY